MKPGHINVRAFLFLGVLVYKFGQGPLFLVCALRVLVHPR